MLSNYRISQAGSLFSEGVETEPTLNFYERMSKRREAIDEDFFIALMRSGIDVAHLLTPRRLPSLARTLRALASRDTAAAQVAPDTRYDRPADSGFVEAARDVSPATLLDAYSRGLILRWIAGRATWWAPAQRLAGDPRNAMEPADACSLLNSGALRITLDREFETVARLCARKAIFGGTAFQPGREGLAALARLHDAGYAHSVEIRDAKNRLAGGCYGISSGRVFVMQSRFGRSPAFKDLAMVVLSRHLAQSNYAHLDMCADWGGQAFGFPVRDRDDAKACLAGYLAGGQRGCWTLRPSLLG